MHSNKTRHRLRLSDWLRQMLFRHQNSLSSFRSQKRIQSCIMTYLTHGSSEAEKTSSMKQNIILKLEELLGLVLNRKRDCNKWSVRPSCESQYYDSSQTHVILSRLGAYLWLARASSSRPPIGGGGMTWRESRIRAQCRPGSHGVHTTPHFYWTCVLYLNC